MPRVELQDVSGTVYVISTASRELLQAWFNEWLPRLYPADADPAVGDPVIRSVYPLNIDSTSGYDWATDSRYLGDFFSIPRDPAQALAVLDQRRAWIDAQKGRPSDFNRWQYEP